MSTMQLCLINNDPTRTLLITPDGRPLYKVESGHSPESVITIRRLERNAGIGGRQELEVGKIEYNEAYGTRLSLTAANLDLTLRPSRPEEDDQSWSFTGPEDRSYKWLLLINSPVLLLDDNSQTPLARYRRAKLGIVSRSRRAFLEIFPAGFHIIDFIVVSFVSFMKQRMTIDYQASVA